MKRNLFKTLFVAVGMTAGMMAPGNADAQNKKVLYATDFETGQAADYWKNGNGYLVTPTYDGTTGQCASIKSNSDRGDYFLTAADYTGVENYTIEFDFLIAQGSKPSELAIMSESAWDSWTFNYGYTWKTSTEQYHNAYLLYMQIPGNGTTATFNEVEDKTYAFTQKTWYHFTVNVDGTSRNVSYSVVPYGETAEVISGTYVMPEGESMNCKGFYERNNRYNYDPGAICIDNVSIYTTVEGEVANIPTVILAGLNGKERTYTINYTDGETLHYQLPGDTDYTSVATGSTVTVSTSTSGTLYAYTTNGEAKSAIVEKQVEAVDVVLNKPTYVLSGLSTGYDKEYTISIDNSSVILAPKANLSCVFTFVDGAVQTIPVENGVIRLTDAGTCVITASADGYTSSSVTIENTVAYEMVKEFKFSEMTDADFSDENLWTAGTDTDSRWGWSEESPGVKYELNDPVTNAATAIDGIELFSDRTPTFYIGYGLMVPYGANYSNIRLTDVKEGQFAVYTRLNNYGKATLTDVKVATEAYALYRYSDMLQNIKVYGPVTSATVSIPSDGLATYTPSVALDFTDATSVAAYKASVAGEVVSLTKVSTVAAGEGVLVRSIAGGEATEEIPVAAEASKADDNAFVGTLTAISALASEADGYRNYILNDGSRGLGFYAANNQAVAAGKAYLRVNAADAAKISFFALDGDLTGIDGVATDVEKKDNVFYNVNGQRVAAPAKGLYILNGKKVIIK